MSVGDELKSLTAITKNIAKVQQWKNEKSNIEAKNDFVSLSVTHTDQEQELFKVLMTVAQTSEEKYHVLDARDKLIRLGTKSMRNLANAGRTVGTCTDMCPEKERLHREWQHQVAVYEQANGCKSRLNHAVAIKQYSRSSADQVSPLAHELRPVEVLQMTMGYLLHRIMDLPDTPDVNLAEWYHFVWDRTRGIRKDITQQELCSLSSVTLVEQCARFHIHCSARLIAEESSVFGEQINTENLTNCLQTLKHMYHDLALFESQVKCANEPEFRAYIILVNLNDANFMWEVQQLPSWIQQSREIKFALEVYSALDKNNYVKFFKLVRLTTYFNACVLLRYFNQIRLKVLRIIMKSYSPRRPYTAFPIAKLTNLLAFENEQNTRTFMKYCGLQLTRENTHVLLDYHMFQPPDIPFSLERAINVIESKRTTSVGEAICGHSLPETTFLQHIPYDSFNANGRLKLSEVSKEWQPKYFEYLQQLRSNNCQERQSSSGDFRVVEKDVELDCTLEETHELEMPSAEFRFFTPPQICSNIPKEQVLSVHNYKFASLKVLMAPDIQEVSELDIEDIPTTSQANVLENIAEQDIKSTFASFVQPVCLNDSKSVTNIAQHPHPAAASNMDVFNITDKTIDNTSAKNTPISLSYLFLIEEMLHMHTEDSKPQSILSPNQPNLNADISLPEFFVSFTSTVNQNIPDSDKEDPILCEQVKHESEQCELIWKAEEQQIASEEKLKSEIGNSLHEVIVQVDQKIRMTRLTDLKRTVETHRLAEYFNKWRYVTRTATKKRKCVFDNPVWISTKSVKTMASELHTKNQVLILNDMKRYKSGTSKQIPLRKPVQVNSIDICQILFETLRGSARLLHLNVYWKIGISMPTDVEDKYGGWYKTQIRDAFQLNANLSAVKRVPMKSCGSITYNVKHVTDLENGLNGLVFIVNEIGDVTHTRLGKLVDRSQPVPVLAILGTNTNACEDLLTLQLKLNDLRSQEAIIDSKLIYSNMNNFETALIDGLKWLATKVEKPLDLEMDSMSSYLHNGVGEVFWHRIHSAADINHLFGKLLTDPNITITLFNEAIRLLVNITLNPEISTQQSFPSEFKHFIEKKQIILPCTYEYFPDNWKCETHVQRMVNIMNVLLLPEYNYSWPAKDFIEFHNSLEDYCARIFDRIDPTVFIKIINVVYERNGCENLQNVCWLDIIQIIVLEKLKCMSFLDESFEFATVVYKKADLKQYLEDPWWYKLKLISDRMKPIQIENFSQSDVTDTETESVTDYLNDNADVLLVRE
ncbi:xmas [Carabus blaptoides fortunei]